MTYAMIEIGYHIGETLFHLFFDERSNDFYEMLCHHLCTCFLLITMIFSNYLSYGCVVAFLHDFSDIFVGLVKITNPSVHEDLTMVFFILNIIVWIWTRNFGLTHFVGMIWREVWNFGGCRDENYPESDFVHTSCACMLSVLVFMQWYWLYMFYVMIYRYLTKGECEDIQNRVESKVHKKE